MVTRRRYRNRVLKLVIIGVLVLGTLELTGCSGGLALEGYRHEDMSRSCYREQIRRKADELANSKRVEDKKTAAELYGSIKELERMDKCIAEYFEKKPQKGLYLMMMGKAVHKFYKSGSRSK